MDQRNSANYRVTRRENVTIWVKPVSVGSFVAAAHNGEPLVDQTPHGKRFSYVITISEQVGNTEIVKIAAQFMGDEPANAKYEIELKGDQGDTSTFTALTIDRPEEDDFTEIGQVLRFKVIA